MSGAPLISVVMSVLNDEQYLGATLDSILSQEGVNLEFVVIDDGSTDRTGQILDDYAARDPRLRVVHQENAGLTRALIRGCELARGKYIARQDGGGDISFPGRLSVQSALFDANPNAVMVSCGTRFVGPEREFLHETVQSSNELQENLDNLDGNRSKGPSSHPSTMFCRSAYQTVGGYRAAFTVAQDQDLWLRFAELGTCVAIPEVFYEARLSMDSISANRRGEQSTTMKAIIACARLRRSGLSDSRILEGFSVNSARKNSDGWIFRSIQDARFNYFIGCLLRKQQPIQAEAYFRKSLRAWLFNPKAILRLCLLRK